MLTPSLFHHTGRMDRPGMTRLLRFLDKAAVCPSDGVEDVHLRLMTLSRKGYIPSVAEVEMIVRYLMASPLDVDPFSDTHKRSHNIHFDAWNLIRRQPLAPATRGFWELHAVEREALSHCWNTGIEDSLDAFDSTLPRFKPDPWEGIKDFLTQAIRWYYRYGWRPVTGVELDRIRDAQVGESSDFGRIVDIDCNGDRVVLRTTSFPLVVFGFTWEGGRIETSVRRLDRM